MSCKMWNNRAIIWWLEWCCQHRDDSGPLLVHKILATRSLLNCLVSDFDSLSWQLNLSSAQNDFSNFRPGWWQFYWITGVKFNSIQSIIVRLLHITQFTVFVTNNLTVFVADSPQCLEWSIMAAVSRALHELSTRRIFFIEIQRQGIILIIYLCQGEMRKSNANNIFHIPRWPVRVSNHSVQRGVSRLRNHLPQCQHTAGSQSGKTS